MPIDFHHKAQQELQQAIAYYDKINLGNAFLDAFERSLQLITQLPEAWTLLFLNIRRCQVKGFPYGIVYRVQSDRVQVLAVMHLQRKPNYWTDRA